MQTAKFIANLSFVILVIVALIVDGFYVYFRFFDPNSTIGTNYITTVETGEVPVSSEDLTEEEKEEYRSAYFLEANYYDNSNENGTALQELKINFASDFELSDYFATGMQYVGDYEKLPQLFFSSDLVDEYVNPVFNYYDFYDGINFKSTMKLNRKTELPISIDGKSYEITLDKFISKSIGAFILDPNIFGRYFNYTWSGLFESVFNAIETNDAGYGDWYIKMDLSKFFTVKTLNEETGVYECDVTSDQIFNYVLVKVHYEPNGARSSEQSLFKIIDDNPAYDLDIDYDTEYWQERVVYNLTADQLDLRYSDTFEGYFASLSIATKALFEDMPRVKVNIVIDMDTSDIVGFDYNAFENLEVDTITITSATNKTFYLLSKSLYDTEFKTLQRSFTVTLNIATNAINNEYAEVVQ